MELDIPDFLRPWKHCSAGVFVYDLAVCQEKGLLEDEGDELMSAAYADGYGFKVDQLVHEWARDQILKISADRNRKVDILDLGGGLGGFCDLVSPVVRRYLNLEPSQLPVDHKFAERLRRGDYFHLRASAHEIPIDDEKLDVVVAIASLDHIPSVELALSEVRRVLRPGGIFLFTINNKHSWWKKLLAGTRFLERREASILKDHYFMWGPSDAEKIVGKYLSKLCLSTTCFVPQVPKLWNLGFPILERLGSATHSLMGSNILGAFKKI